MGIWVEQQIIIIIQTVAIAIVAIIVIINAVTAERIGNYWIENNIILVI
jgi:hypothetical protein